MESWEVITYRDLAILARLQFRRKSMKKIVYYTNQFFGQIGGEEMASISPRVIEGAIGPAVQFNKIQEAMVVETILCGDNYYAQNMEECRAFIFKEIEKIKPDMLIAGPAFHAGRFGIACADICVAVKEKFNIETMTGLYIENPAVLMYKGKTYMIETGKNAASMRTAIPTMIRLTEKLLFGKNIGTPEEEGYIPMGIRKNIFKEKNGATRALDMLITKLKGLPIQSEIPIPEYHEVLSAEPIKQIKSAKIALITTGGIVLGGNPDHMPAATAKFYKSYDILGLDRLEAKVFESVHAGYDPVYANADPNRVVPLDALRIKEKKREIGSIYEKLVTTTGNSTSVSDATRMGEEIAQQLLEAKVDGVLLTST